MGRLQTLIALSICLSTLQLLGCEQDKSSKSAPTSRRDAVVASGSAVATTTAPAPSAHPTAPAKPRALCSGAALNRSMPADRVGHAEATGTAALGDEIAVGNGKWTWINLWAAWCAPCKEEMPRLLKWQQKLAANMNLQFVSLDDDQRQLMRFLEAQPKDGMRASYWLPEGKTRDNWLNGQHLKNPPQLPVQILVNPQGKVHCVIEGAVDESDFPAVSAIVSR